MKKLLILAFVLLTVASALSSQSSRKLTTTKYNIYFKNTFPEVVIAHLNIEDRGDPYLNIELKPGETKYIVSTMYNYICAGCYSKASGKLLTTYADSRLLMGDMKTDTGVVAYGRWLPDFSYKTAAPKEVNWVELLGEQYSWGTRNFVVENGTGYKVRIFGRFIAGANDYGYNFEWATIEPYSKAVVHENVENAISEIRFYAEPIGRNDLFWGGYDYRKSSQIPRDSWFLWGSSPNYYPQSYINAYASSNIEDIKISLSLNEANKCKYAVKFQNNSYSRVNLYIRYTDEDGNTRTRNPSLDSDDAVIIEMSSRYYSWGAYSKINSGRSIRSWGRQTSLSFDDLLDEISDSGAEIFAKSDSLEESDVFGVRTTTFNPPD